MDTNKSVFLISNGSEKTHPNNTLTKFTNKLPEAIEIPQNEKYEMAVESVGFSCYFRNIKLPEDDFYPSFIISNCIKSTDMTRDGRCVYGQELDKICSSPITFKFFDNEDMKNCYWYMGRFSEKYYTENELTTFFDAINREYNTEIKFVDGLLQFGREFDQPWYWVLVHPTMMETFGFEASMYLKYKYNEQLDFKSIFKIGDSVSIHSVIEEEGVKTLLWRKKVLEKLVNYNGHLYFAYQIGLMTNFLRASNNDISKRCIPRLVKVESDNIEPQIFNNSFSNDLVVFGPDFQRNEDYYFHEFETKQYVPILNSTITDFDIRLCDEDNKQLQLLPGVPTILKVDIRKMETQTRFNVRLTSIKTKEFKNNTNSHFKVKLPNVLSLDSNWRVALTSISHPNVYKTFLPDKQNRGMYVRQVEGNTIVKQAIKIYKDDLYTLESLVYELQEFFTKHNFGRVTESPDHKLTITFEKTGSFYVSNNVLRVLGYNDRLNQNEKATEIFIDRNNNNLKVLKDENDIEKYVLEFNEPINMDFLKPNYIISYTNFIESSIIGGIYSKILRVIPLASKERGFVITEFKHNEYIKLQNTEISEIEINLRSHDGEYVNFGTQEDVIFNLEFTTV